MMGRQEAAPQLFYDFRLDDHVPADHMLRGIDRFLQQYPPNIAIHGGSGALLGRSSVAVACRES
jgi:hypothetical protein